VTFACVSITPPLEERISKEGFGLKKIYAEAGSKNDQALTCSLITALGAEEELSVVLDGYQFDGEFQRELKKTGCRLMVMDDYGHAEFYHADWVLNQNLSSSKDLYANRSPWTQLLLGTKYSLLREEFLKYQGFKREIPDIARKVLVTLGGADPDNVTQKVIQVLAGIDLKMKVVVGGSNPHLASLRQTVTVLGGAAAQIELVVNPKNIPELMAWADLAVAAGGSTAWELSFMGVPSIYLILAENQREISLALERLEMGLSLDACAENLMNTLPIKIQEIKGDQKLRQTISANTSRIVDGLGAARVCEHLSNT